MGDSHQAFGDKYELTRRIAEGGMAEIFVAKAKGAAGFNKIVSSAIPTGATRARERSTGISTTSSVNGTKR